MVQSMGPGPMPDVGGPHPWMGLQNAHPSQLMGWRKAIQDTIDVVLTEKGLTHKDNISYEILLARRERLSPETD